MRHQFSTKMVLWNNLHKLSFHYCIVQQASSTAKATPTARLMSGNIFFFLLEKRQTHISVVFQIHKVTGPCHSCVHRGFSFTPTPVASSSSPLLQGIGFTVPFRAVLHHWEQMDQYFDIYKRSIVLEGEANILSTVLVNMVTPGHGNWSKNNRTFNLSFLVLQCRTSQHNFHPYQFNTTK